jgi:hypothetical protein
MDEAVEQAPVRPRAPANADQAGPRAARPSTHEVPAHPAANSSAPPPVGSLACMACPEDNNPPLLRDADLCW